MSTISHIEKELLEYINQHPVINTHTHHLPDNFFVDFGLDSLIKQGYVHWLRYDLDTTFISRQNYLDKVRFKSYFIWLNKALKEIYHFDTLTASNYDEIDLMIKTAHKESAFHLDLLKTKCNYQNIVLDAYWQPGSDNDHPEMFSSTFRIDPLLQGYSKEAVDHDGNNPFLLYERSFNNLDDYTNWIKDLIKQKKQQGCIALKSAVAYDRGLAFKTVSKQRAERIFNIHEHDINNSDVIAFQDYIFQLICELAAEHSLPLQCHTGMGTLSNTRALAMQEVIEKNPKTKFVLFHCSFPWTEDMNALLHNYDNVYPDLCWLPLLSPTSAKKTLHELIEVTSSDKICWGCDTRTSEESYGALLAFRYVLSEVLLEKISDNYLTLSDALVIIDNIMVNNPKKLYSI